MSTKQGIPPCLHTVEPGDTFAELALAYYGFTGGAAGSDDFAVNLIANSNDGVEAEDLQIGQVLMIPQFHGPGA